VRELKREQHHRQSIELRIGVLGPSGIIHGICPGEFLGAKADVLAHARGEVGKFRCHGGFYLQAGFSATA